MSGGSLDYAYMRVDEIADEVKKDAKTSLQRAFAVHLKLVAKALHDLEWVWSNDYGPGDEIEAIKAVVSNKEVIECATERAREVLNELKEVLGEK